MRWNNFDCEYATGLDRNIIKQQHTKISITAEQNRMENNIPAFAPLR
jgi:hypothetical protein